MPPSASTQGRIPAATSAMAPASAQAASGRRKGRTITPAVAGMMMPQARMVSCEAVSTLVPDPSRYSAAIAEVDRAVCPVPTAGNRRDPRLRQCEKAEPDSDRGDRTQREKGGAVAGLDHHYSCQRRGQRRADALRRDHRALGYVEASGTAHQIGHDH